MESQVIKENVINKQKKTTDKSRWFGIKRTIYI